MIEALGLDFLSAPDAPAIVATIDPLQRGIDAVALGLAVPLRRQSHCLHLHGVDPRQAADAFLIERDRRAHVLGYRIVSNELIAQRQ
ncbi:MULTISPECIES: hypothetical protein [Sphingomonas]|uniref:hypothetical protein n=1 Tax=Sphingomonas TaxID=13687 RepID=UPI001E32DFEC|nr:MULTISPECIES: hypothetical protein [Sphingomonas]WCP73707.1 hypothetical protein PPZ50_03850 [Sphingomonas hankookensis]